MIAREERAALRTFLRALRLLPADLEWRATVWSSRPLAAPATLGRMLRDRVRFVDASQMSEAEAIAAAGIVVLASEGVRVDAGHARAGARRAGGPGRLPPRPLRGAAVRGPLRARVRARRRPYARGASRAAVCESRRHTASSYPRPSRSARRCRWPRLTDDLEQVYGDLVARRHDGRGVPRLRRKLAGRPLIDVDLHMHTDHSYDCATPVEVLLAEARARGLGAIAVTDHNEISGALEAQAKADGVKVIVGEEVKTADQGEVIGLFITEKIRRGMTLQETIAEIKRQGGLVYVPHPFDRLHSVPDYKHLLDVLDDVDAIEVFNPRIAITEFNEEAVRFAAKYRIPAGAGSDAHVPQGLGSVRIRMRDFDGPEEFLESLRDADIVRNPASLLYVQALKFIQTKALPESARRASRDRRVRRVQRKS